MIARARLVVSLLAALALAAPGRPCRAAGGEGEKQAQELFLDAMKLMAKKQYAEACDRLAHSLELDPGMGTRFRLAECYEKLGRLASACDQYASVADAAKAAGKPDREAVARKRAATLEPKVAKLTVVLPPAVAVIPGVEVLRDGALMDKAAWGTPVPIDPGDHVVTVRAPGKKPFEGKVWAESAARLTVAVAALEEIPSTIEIVSEPKSSVPAIVLASGGVLGIGLGATFAILRAGKVSSAQSLHDQIIAARGTCYTGGKQTASTDCPALAGAAASGDKLGTAAVVAFSVGSAALVGMTIYLLIPAAKTVKKTPAAFQWAPTFSAGQAGVVAWGSF